MAPDQACLDAFQRELDYIWRTLRRLGVPPSEIEDVAQDAFLALRGAWSDYDQSRPLRPYLFGIAFRIASAQYRKRGREVALGMLEVLDSTPDPEDALETKQARALVLAALERVPLPRRAVLVMHDLDDVAMVDVASTLSIPLFTAYSRLRKARKELETAIRRYVREEGRR
jgi:RNA polymerase sigma-70 factor (ECF subfamily)